MTSATTQGEVESKNTPKLLVLQLGLDKEPPSAQKQSPRRISLAATNRCRSYSEGEKVSLTDFCGGDLFHRLVSSLQPLVAAREISQGHFLPLRIAFPILFLCQMALPVLFLSISGRHALRIPLLLYPPSSEQSSAAELGGTLGSS